MELVSHISKGPVYCRSEYCSETARVHGMLVSVRLADPHQLFDSRVRDVADLSGQEASMTSSREPCGFRQRIRAGGNVATMGCRLELYRILQRRIHTITLIVQISRRRAVKEM
jgi:hypothetical protein